MGNNPKATPPSKRGQYNHNEINNKQITLNKKETTMFKKLISLVAVAALSVMGLYAQQFEQLPQDPELRNKKDYLSLQK